MNQRLKKYALTVFLASLTNGVSAQALDSLLNRANGAIATNRDAEQRKAAQVAQENSLNAVAFRTPSEFAKIYEQHKRGNYYDTPILGRSLEILYKLNGGNSYINDATWGSLCDGSLAKSRSRLLSLFMDYKLSELSSSPPTFHKEPDQRVTNELVELIRLEKIASAQKECGDNSRLVDLTLRQLSDAANEVNEQRRVPLKANYAKQVQEETARKKLEDENNQRRLAEKKAEDERLENERKARIAREIEAERKAIEEKQRIEAERKAKRVGG